MSDAQQVAARKKQEVASKDEKTVSGRFYSPSTDLFETNDALMVIMEIPGVGR